MRPFKIGMTHQVILDGISRGLSIRKIAASLGINPSSVLRDIKQMESRGYIARQVRSNQVLYSILPSGMSLMQHPVKTDLTGGSINATPREEIKVRLHRLQIKFDLVTPVDARNRAALDFNPHPHPMAIAFKDFPSKTVPLESWNKSVIQFEDFTAIVSTKSLIIAGIQRYLDTGSSIQGQEADILSAIMPFAEQVEEKIRRISPSFKLKRLDRGVLSGNIISREYAFEHHPIANKVVGEDRTMLIRAKDGKPRIIVDQSKGHPELETVHEETSAEDADMLNINTEVLATTDLRQAIQAIQTSAPIILEQSKLFATTQDQISQLASHIQAIVGIIGGGLK